MSIFRFFVLGVLPKIFSMARPNNSNLGFTLVEMLAVVIITGILAAIALPSFLKNRTFATTIPQIESTLRLVSLKARASSGNPYRVTLGNRAGEQFLDVRYLANSACTTTNTVAWESNKDWKQEPNLILSLPTTVVISNFPSKGFCFNSRGEAVLSPGSVAADSRSFTISNTSSGKVAKAVISISLIGDNSRATYDANNVSLDGKLN